MRVNRRRFLAGAATCIVGSRCAGRSEAAEPIRLATFLDWQRASRDARERELQPLAARIRQLDGPIHAWVQIAPEKPTGSGALDSIPFGVKDIIETKGLATEYGSPIYKGRIGTDDAAIVRDLRGLGGVVMGKRTPPRSRSGRRRRRATRAISRTHPAAARADRRRRSRPA
jgi:Amidase